MYSPPYTRTFLCQILQGCKQYKGKQEKDIYNWWCQATIFHTNARIWMTPSSFLHASMRFEQPIIYFIVIPLYVTSPINWESDPPKFYIHSQLFDWFSHHFQQLWFLGNESFKPFDFHSHSINLSKISHFFCR